MGIVYSSQRKAELLHIFVLYLFVEVKLLLPDGVLTFLYNGLQRQALLDVANSGYEALKDPTNAFELLLSAGVIPNNTADQVNTMY